MSATPVPYANLLIPVLLTVFILDLVCVLSAALSGRWFLVASLVLAAILTGVAARVLKGRR